jgi:putative membrane protein
VIKFALKVVVLAAVFYGLTRYDVLPGLDVVENPEGPLGVYGTYLWLGLLFGVVNAIVGPVLRLLSLPFVLLTLGLFLLVINAALLKLTSWVADKLDIGFHVTGFWPAVGGAIVITVVTWIVDSVIGESK